MSFTPMLALHIPDGFLSAPVALSGWAIMVVLVGLALRQTRDTLGDRQIPLMGILAAFHKPADKDENSQLAHLTGNAYIKQSIIYLPVRGHHKTASQAPAVHNRDQE